MVPVAIAIRSLLQKVLVTIVIRSLLQKASPPHSHAHRNCNNTLVANLRYNRTLVEKASLALGVPVAIAIVSLNSQQPQTAAISGR